MERFSWRPDISNDILAAAAEMGYPIPEELNGDQSTGFTVAQMMSKDGVRRSSATAFLRPFRDRRNLRVVTNATVTKIIVQEKKAVGVQYYKVNQLRFISFLFATN